MARNEELLVGARSAVDRALARRRRVAVGLAAAGFASLGLASPVQGQVADDGTTPTTDDATPPSGGTDPFDAGSEPVPTEAVSGDDTGAPPSTQAPAADDGAFATETVAATGDGESKWEPVHTASAGALSLFDGAGNVWLLNTDMSFSTTSSASGAFSDASMTTSQSGVSTSAGGTTTSTLDDAFDGYAGMCLDLGGAGGTPATCSTDDSNQAMYNQLGPLVGVECSGQEAVLPVSNDVAEISQQRRVFVPSAAGASFARWTETFTNTTGSPQTARVTLDGNLGSDSDTVVTGSSSGDTTGADGDLWVSTFQDYSGSTSSDPRLGHVLGGAGAQVAPSGLLFADGNDDVNWSYELSLAPGQTVTVVHYVSLNKSKAAAAASAAALSAGTAAHQWDCMTDVERNQIVNFANRAAAQPETNDPASPPTGSFTTGTSTATEGTTHQVTVQRAGNIDEARTFVLTLGGTATSDDYTAPSLQVTFAAGERTKVISIPIATDAITDAGETIILILSDPNTPADPIGAAPAPNANSQGAELASLGTTTTHVVTIVDAQVSPTTIAQPQPLARTGAEIDGLMQLAGSSMLLGGAAVLAGDARRRRLRWRHRRS